MQDEVAPLVPARRGKKPTAPDHIKVYKTAVFKIHNPSKHKRAMLTDSMKRAHFAYTRLLAELMPDVERFAGMTKKARNAEMQTRIYRFVRPLPLGQAAKAGIRIDVQGQLNSYIELRKDQEGAQVPTASRLNEETRPMMQHSPSWPRWDPISTARTSYETNSPGSRNRLGCVPSTTMETRAATTSS